MDQKSSQHIETITHGLEPITLISRADYDVPGIQFFTPGSFPQQVAYMKHPQGHKIAAHVHNMMTRQVLYTQEVLVVRRGKMKVKLYASSKEYIGDRCLHSGDLILLCGGGPGDGIFTTPFNFIASMRNFTPSDLPEVTDFI